MKLTREEALRLHRQMWSDMQKDLGDCPDYHDRIMYKYEWCKKNFPYNYIKTDCFLCEYVVENDLTCTNCPIDWGGSSCRKGKVTYHRSPISEILALPEREVEE